MEFFVAPRLSKIYLALLLAIAVMGMGSTALASTLSGSATGNQVNLNLSCTGAYCDLYRESTKLVTKGGGSHTYSETVANGSYTYFLKTYTAGGASGPSLTETDAKSIVVGSNVNAPTISNITDQTINENSSKTISFTVSDVETSPGSLSIIKSSNNLAVVPYSNIVLGGSGSNRTVKITPATNAHGWSIISLTVMDEGGKTASKSFVVKVKSNANTSVRRVMFIHTDLLGSPAAETDEEGF